MRSAKSILFVRPDYHCSFAYRDQFRKMGWKADIFVNRGYPPHLLYSDHDILTGPKLYFGEGRLGKWLNHFVFMFGWLCVFWRYRYHLYYGRPPVLSLLEEKIGLTRLFGRDFVFELFLSRLFGIKLIFLATGCHDDESKKNFSKLDGGNVCANCGAWDKCDDELNSLNFDRIRRYFSMQVGVGAIDSTQYRMTHMKYKSIDLDLWHPDIPIPEPHRLPKTKNLRIMHAADLEKSGRNWGGRNIKGSPHVVAAVRRLEEEGFDVEYFYVSDVPSNQMRFYQAQADVVVDQLVYGWWGSTFVEASALGKPVVCYLRPSWKAFFLATFPEYSSLPVVEADTNSIYEALKKLVTDESYRRKKGEESRQFAEAHFDPKKNAKAFSELLEAL